MAISYADGIREARDWVVEHFGDDSAPYALAFINWYAWNARIYTIESAWAFYLEGPDAPMGLREGEREMSSAELQSRTLHPANQQGREIVPVEEDDHLPRIAIWA